MTRLLRALMLLPLLLPVGTASAQDGRISFLEQEVRNLQRQVLVLSRQVDELRTRPGQVSPAAPPASTGPTADPSQWLDAAKWKKLRPGMTELEVIGALGPPTSMRDENDARVLYYALEIGSSGYLGGSVTMRDRAVVEIRQPTLQ